MSINASSYYEVINSFKLQSEWLYYCCLIQVVFDKWSVSHAGDMSQGTKKETPRLLPTPRLMLESKWARHLTMVLGVEEVLSDIK